MNDEEQYYGAGHSSFFILDLSFLPMHVSVIPSGRSKFTGKGLTYATEDENIQPGSFVEIPLMKRSVEGIVFGASKLNEKLRIRSIQKMIGADPLVPQHLLKLAQWISTTYFCSPRDALSVILPSPPWKLLLPKTGRCYRLIDNDLSLRGKRQQAILEALQDGEEHAEQTLMEETGASKEILRRMVAKAMIGSTERVIETAHAEISIIATGRPKLSEGQSRAVTEIESSSVPSLLFGITSSGKTEVYVALIARALENGKQAMLLVPEIFLTDPVLERFRRLIPEDCIAILHSRHSLAYRRTLWRKIRSGGIRLVIGSRSALFAPLPNPGLIILDEEHEWTYKNEHTPRYHARETAEELARMTGARLVLGSATPSLESWSRTNAGRYQLVRLPERWSKAALPTVRVIDLTEVSFDKHYPFSLPLIEAIQSRLDRKEQSILFLNRRGMATSLLCFACRRRIVSPETNLPFTVHCNSAGTLYLADHISGATAKIPERCPGCRSTNLKPVGAGTQRVEALLHTLFPKARIARADSDTLTTTDRMRTVLSDVRNGTTDILIGTQAVAKGLDMPGVTLAAVLLADTGLTLPHFRAGERTFQLLTQLIGRSGRHRPGEVIVQTFRPKAPEIAYAVSHRTEAYLNEEMRLRSENRYPPSTRMIRLLFRGEHASKRAMAIAASALKIATIHAPALRIGSAPTFHGGGKEWHVIMRGHCPEKILPHMDLEGVVIDVDPVECL